MESGLTVLIESGGKLCLVFTVRRVLAITTVDTNTEAFSRTARLTTHTDTAVACTAVHSLHIRVSISLSTSLIVGQTL